MSNRGQQKSQHIHDIENLQCKAIEIMNFKSKYAPSKLLFIDFKKMTLQDIIKTNHTYTKCCLSTDNLTPSQNYELD